MDLEHAHMHPTPDERFRDGYPYVEALKQAHATYAGFHGRMSEWYPAYKHLHEYIVNRLGYWYFIDGYALPDEVISHAKAMLTLAVQNMGFAVAYNRYEARVRIVSDNGATYDIPCSGCDNTRWQPNTRYTENIKLKFDNVPIGNYEVHFGLFNSENRAVEFAVKTEHISDGYIVLGNIRVV